MVYLHTLTLKVGEDVLIPHEEVACDQNKAEIHRGVICMVLSHELEDPLHSQTLHAK